MSDLLSAVLEALGGLERWNGFSRVQASIVTGGELWGIKGLVQDPAPRRMTVAMHEQWASVQPFGSPGQKTDFTRDRIAIEKLDGQVVRRHDYRVAVAGGFAAAQYVHDIIEVDGFRLPSRRLAYRCGADGRPNLEQLMVSIDLSDIHFG